MNCGKYILADNIPEALQALSDCGGRARLIAGGTDLVLQQRRHKWDADTLVDITRLPDLDKIELKDGILSLGCLVTHAQAAESILVRKHLPALAEACATVGSPQIRNVGTLVGNVVTAQPGADGALALHAFETRARIHTLKGTRIMDLPELYEGLGQCRVDSCQELISHLEVDLSSGPVFSAFERLSQRGALTLPVVNTAVSLFMNKDGKSIAKARVVVGPVASTPFRASEAERILKGQEPSSGLWIQAARSAARESRPRASLLRGGREYRQAMVEVLVRRALDNALNRRAA